MPDDLELLEMILTKEKSMYLSAFAERAVGI